MTKEKNQLTYYANCPICGYKLCKAAIGSFIEIKCPNCKREVNFEVDDEEDEKIVICKLKNPK